MFRSKTWIGYSAILTIGLALAVGVGTYWWHEYDQVRQHYVQNASADTRFVADKAETAFSSIYQNIRTLSFLPSIRTIDRQGTNLSAEAKATIQQVYNNLADSVDVSEVYFLPVDFDPEKIDPVTGHHEAPILAFDQLIAPSHDAAGSDDSGGNNASTLPPDQDFVGLPDEAGIPQIEIQEYRELKKQLTWLQANYPTLDKINGLNVPMIGSPELITCDNTVFDKTRNDDDRRGIIQLVPFYGVDGKLRGGVAAIMRSNAYRGLLPNNDYALINPAYGFATRPEAGGQEAGSSQWVKAGKPDPSLIYSEIMPVKTPDGTSKWAVWAGLPNATFDASSEAVNVRYAAIGSFAAITFLVLAAMVVCFLMGRSMRAALAASALLENRVSERTAEIQGLATAAEEANACNLARVVETSSLNNHLGKVIGLALAGDFSGRVDVELVDPDLTALANNVNGLVDTVERGISETGRVLSALAHTDLTQRVEGHYQGALARLKDDTNSVADRLGDVILQLRAASGAVKAATAEILSGTNDLAERTTKQAKRVEETSSAVGHLDSTTIEIAKQADSANAKARAVAQTAEETGEVMTMADAAMGRISSSSSKISSVIGLIDDIAFQTNLLALNASVEAARAGDAGKGFAVVAVEVRRLAQSAAQASSEVKVLVEQAATEVAGGYKLVADASRSLGTMLDGIRENSDLVDSIAKATQEQSKTISQISGAVREIDAMTQHNAALVEETTAAIEQTEEQANELDRLVDVFVVAEADHRVDFPRGSSPGELRDSRQPNGMRPVNVVRPPERERYPLRASA